MPLFEYKCRDCRKKFELLRSANDQSGLNCPACNSIQIDKVFSAFASQTASGSASAAGSSCANRGFS